MLILRPPGVPQTGAGGDSPQDVGSDSAGQEAGGRQGGLQAAGGDLGPAGPHLAGGCWGGPAGGKRYGARHHVRTQKKLKRAVQVSLMCNVSTLLSG